MPAQTTPTGPQTDFVYNPGTLEFDRDPFPVYDYMREHVPMYFWPQVGAWVVTRYTEVETVLRDPRFSVELRHYESVADSYNDDDLTVHQLLAKYGLFWLSDTDHARVRQIAAPLFTSRAVESMAPVFQRVIDEVLDAAQTEEGTLDLARDVSAHYPLRAVTEVLGIPKHRHAEFRMFGSAVIDSFLPAISDDALAQKQAYLPKGVAMLEELIEERRVHPTDDFLSQLMYAEKDGQRLTHKELLSMVALMISAGCEPPRHLINFTILNLLRHPDQMQLLQGEPELLRGAVDEAGRYDHFGKTNLPRFALEDVDMLGHTIHPGQPVFSIFASALRDPAAFDHAARFDIRRKDPRSSIQYGAGMHNCLGMALARLMVSTAVGTLVRRYPGMWLLAEPVYTPDSFFRKMISLPLGLHPAA